MIRSVNSSSGQESSWPTVRALCCRNCLALRLKVEGQQVRAILALAEPSLVQPRQHISKHEIEAGARNPRSRAQFRVQN